jgi:hypothetical protein
MSWGRWKVLFAAIVVVGLSMVPYVIGWAVQGDQVFGGFVLDIHDSNSYLAVMQLGMQGKWRFVSLYTPEPQDGVWMYTHYVLMGHLVRWTGIAPLAVYHGARVILGVVLLMAIYRFASFLLDRDDVCWTAFLLAALSSGLGWFTELFWPTAPGGISPVDFWFLDAYTFLGLLTFPHFSLAWTALLIAFGSAVAYRASPRLCYLAVGGGAAFLATAVHPTLSLLMGGVAVIYGGVLWIARRRFPSRWAVGGGAIVLASGSVSLGLLLAFRADPVLSAWGEAIMHSPPLRYFLLGYGVLVPFVLVGIIDLIKRRDWRSLFLAAWVVGAFILAYSPFNMQRRMLEGVHIPISLLAAVGLHSVVLPWLTRSRLVRGIARLGYPVQRTLWWARGLLIVLASLSSLYMVGAASMVVWARSPGFFYSADQLAAFDWLSDNLAFEDAVFSSYKTGNLIPAWAGRRVFVGHWAESVDWPNRERQTEAFFDDGMGDVQRLTLLKKHDITHVFYGSDERALGDFDPAVVSWLEPVFQSGDIIIYRVMWEDP